MANILEDGTGDAFKARVDDTHRLHVRAVADASNVEAVLEGDHHILATARITLTTDSTSSLMFFSNNEARGLFIDRLIVTVGASAGATENSFFFSGMRNPTGLLNGSGNPLVSTNSSFSSSVILDAPSEMGLEGTTTIGGNPILGINLKLEDSHFTFTRLLLAKSNSISFAITPPAGNTSMVVTIAASGFLIRPEPS